MHKKSLGIMAGILMLTLLVTGCGQNKEKKTGIQVVSSLDFYGEAAQAVLGKQGHVTAIINSPSLDPHSYEATTNDAKLVAKADVIIENGLGYDRWLNKLVNSAQSDTQTVLTVSQLMKRADGANEHLWYDLKTMPALTKQLVHQFSKRDPKHKAIYAKNGAIYLKKLAALDAQRQQLQAKAKGQQVAASEPVFDYALEEMGYQIANRHFAKAIEDGTDPSPSDITKLRHLIREQRIAFLVVNKQEESPIVKQLHELADKEGVPVVQVTETLPAKQTYLTWMQQQFNAVRKAQDLK
ncbi:metal ABC transporter solute-binding protein, Zn/Mn family [Latilactobacillus graminis]|uniref:Periplasmic solute binding family protein n=2 Tax=Latilactobacillus graminis TaxID=60519 RepID=A0AA89I2Q6_9LACO|nr:zinc ABC transporter substrate-binding protein [Latilactobacillus graminis]KRM24331.1 periplasmic solute binding family protein [Latilactobacillus graminis DSM 20719]QFP80114.1 metal ABC transporter substrate-binding protein [Latilactobacillus graminis]